MGKLSATDILSASAFDFSEVDLHTCPMMAASERGSSSLCLVLSCFLHVVIWFRITWTQMCSDAIISAARVYPVGGCTCNRMVLCMSSCEVHFVYSILHVWRVENPQYQDFIMCYIRNRCYLLSTVVHNIEHIPVSSHLSCAIIVHPNRCKPNNNTTFFMVMVDSWLHLFFFALHWPLAILSTHHILYPGSSHTRAPRCRGRERSGWMACPLIPKWDGSYLRGFAKKTGNQHQPSPMKLGDTGVRVKNQRGDLESLPFCLH